MPARRCAGCISPPPASSAASPWACRRACTVTNSTGVKADDGGGACHDAAAGVAAATAGMPPHQRAHAMRARRPTPRCARSKMPPSAWSAVARSAARWCARSRPSTPSRSRCRARPRPGRRGGGLSARAHARGAGKADAVVICTAGDEQHPQMIGARELAAMKPTAHAGQCRARRDDRRGGVDRGIAGGRLAGAASTATRSSRCRPIARLWDMPNVIVSPHIAGGGSTGYLMHRKLFAQNLERCAPASRCINECKVPAKA